MKRGTLGKIGAAVAGAVLGAMVLGGTQAHAQSVDDYYHKAEEDYKTGHDHGWDHYDEHYHDKKDDHAKDWEEKEKY